MSSDDTQTLIAMAGRIRGEILSPLRNGTHPQHEHIPEHDGRRLDELVGEVCMAIANPGVYGNSPDLIHEAISYAAPAITSLANTLREAGERKQAELLGSFAAKVAETYEVSVEPFPSSSPQPASGEDSAQCTYSEELLGQVMRLARAATIVSSAMWEKFKEYDIPVHHKAKERDQRICELLFEAEIGDEAMRRVFGSSSIRYNLLGTPNGNHALKYIKDHYKDVAEKPALTDAYVEELFRLTMEAIHYASKGCFTFPDDRKKVKPLLEQSDKLLKELADEMQAKLAPDSTEEREQHPFETIAKNAEHTSRGSFTAGRATGRA